MFPSLPPTPLKDRKRKGKNRKVSPEDYCHTAVTVMVPRRQEWGGGGGGGGWGRDSLTSLLFLVISSACGER